MDDWKNFIGVLLPPIIDTINVWVPNTKVRFLVSMIICFAVGYMFHAKEINSVETFLAKGGLIFTEAQIIYRLYWQRSTPRDKMIKNFVGEDK